MSIMGGDIVLGLGDLTCVRPACLSDLLDPLGLAALVVLLRLLERLPSDFDGRIVTLLAPEYAAEASRGLRFELRPLRSRQRSRELTEIKWRHCNLTPERVEADAGISRQRRP